MTDNIDNEAFDNMQAADPDYVLPQGSKPAIKFGLPKSLLAPEKDSYGLARKLFRTTFERYVFIPFFCILSH